MRSSAGQLDGQVQTAYRKKLILGFWLPAGPKDPDFWGERFYLYIYFSGVKVGEGYNLKQILVGGVLNLTSLRS